MYGKFLMA